MKEKYEMVNLKIEVLTHHGTNKMQTPCWNYRYLNRVLFLFGLLDGYKYMIITFPVIRCQLGD